MHTHTGRKTTQYKLFMVIAISLLVGACASVDKGAVRTTVGSAESALNQAIESDAREHAPLELKMAQEKLSQAKSAIENDNYKKANDLAEEARADARLAQAKAESAETERMVQTVRESIDDLRQEIEQRNTVQ
ncbi:MAG: DUF4398 domain-containing protein [Desulfosarcina sp.]